MLRNQNCEATLIMEEFALNISMHMDDFVAAHGGSVCSAMLCVWNKMQQGVLL